MLRGSKVPFRDWTPAEWDAFYSNTLANFATIAVILIVVAVYARRERPRLVAAIVEAS